MKKIIGLIILCFFVLLYFGNVISNNTLDTLSSDEIIVYVKGEVIQEKEVVLPKYSTFRDLLKNIELTEQSDITVYSEKQVLHNRDIIEIPQKRENRISINYGLIEDLMLIPGVGESTAISIIEYRTNYGFFTQLEDLMNVKGIKEKKYLKIKDYIKL